MTGAADGMQWRVVQWGLWHYGSAILVGCSIVVSACFNCYVCIMYISNWMNASLGSGHECLWMSILE